MSNTRDFNVWEGDSPILDIGNSDFNVWEEDSPFIDAKSQTSTPVVAGSVSLKIVHYNLGGPSLLIDKNTIHDGLGLIIQ